MRYQDPYEHIAQLLMEHSLKTKPSSGGDRKSERRVSLGGEPVAAGERRVSLSMETYEHASEKKKVTIGGAEEEKDDEERKTTLSGEELERQFVKNDESIEMSAEVEALLKTFFDKMDVDGDGDVTKDEAISHWGKNFAKVNATSMFNEVDEVGNDSVSWADFLAFWKNVVGSGYSQEDILEEVQMMIEGGSWVDFDDGRTT